MNEGDLARRNAAQDRPMGRLAELPHRFRIIRGLESASLDRLPSGTRGVVTLAIVAAVAFAFLRLEVLATLPGHPTIRIVYTESPIFLVAAIAIGLLSRTTGLAFLAAFALGDLVVWLLFSSRSFADAPSLITFAGRLISYWLLWLLVITIPRHQRTIRAMHAARGAQLASLAPLVSAAATGAMVWAWTAATPYLIRPVFSNSAPTYEAMSPLQERGDALAAAASIIAVVVALLFQRGPALAADAVALLPMRAWEERLGPISRVVRYAVAIVLLLGLITSWLDVVLLAGGFIVGDLLAARVANAAPMRGLLLRVPLLARVVIGLVAVFAIGQIVGSVWYQPISGLSEFFPLVLTLALGFVMFRLLLGADAGDASPRATQAPKPLSSAAAGVLLFVGLLGVQIAFPTPVFADNCSGLLDCAGGWLAAIGAGLAAIVAALWDWISGVFAPTPPVIGELQPLLSEEGAQAQHGALEMLRKLVADTVMRDTGDMDEYYRIKEMPLSQFADEAKTGRWDGILGYQGSYGGGGGVVGASRG